MWVAQRRPIQRCCCQRVQRRDHQTDFRPKGCLVATAADQRYWWADQMKIQRQIHRLGEQIRTGWPQARWELRRTCWWWPWMIRTQKWLVGGDWPGEWSQTQTFLAWSLQAQSIQTRMTRMPVLPQPV